MTRRRWPKGDVAVIQTPSGGWRFLFPDRNLVMTRGQDRRYRVAAHFRVKHAYRSRLSGLIEAHQSRRAPPPTIIMAP